MIDLTLPEWEFIQKTPAGGLYFYNYKLDQVAIQYNDYINLYFDRKENNFDNYAISFKHKITINRNN